MLALSRFFSKYFNYLALYGVAVGAVWGGGWYAVSNAYQYASLPIANYSSERCILADNGQKPTLKVLDAISLSQSHSLKELCQIPGLDQWYSAVEVHAVPRDGFNVRDLFDQRFDLLLAKPELIESLTRLGRTYVPVASYGDYGSEFLSLQDMPELTHGWWQGKTLGLYDEPYSVSGYQIPKLTLQQHGLDGIPKIVYFHNQTGLMRALVDGQVDVIASATPAVGDSPNDNASTLHRLALASHLQGPAWYFRQNQQASFVQCSLIQGLVAISQNSSTQYLRSLRIKGVCHDQV